MSYQVQGIAYDTREAAMTALIAKWVSRSGEASRDEVEFEMEQSDTAVDIISEWGGDLGSDFVTASDLSEHMANYYNDIMAEAL